MGWRWRRLGRWWFVASVATLALNDHVLKDLWPGWWTGKLSDVAGPAVVATLLGIVVGRTPAVALTAVGFVALKTVPGVAELAAPVLGGVTRTDPTDVIGVVGLALTWWGMAGTQDPPGESGATRAGGPSAEASWSTARRAARLVALSAAVLAITASVGKYPTMVNALVERDGRLYVELESDDPGTWTRWAVSDDGGLTWNEVPTDPGLTSEPSVREVCRSDGWCFRAVGDAIEERSPGGSWRHSYGYGDSREKLIEYESGGGLTENRFDGLVVVPVDGGEHVVVDASDQGVVVLDSEGTWIPTAVLWAEPSDPSGLTWPLTIVTPVFLLSGPAALAAVVVLTHRHPRPVGCGGFLLVLLTIALYWGLGFLVLVLLQAAVIQPVVVAAVVAGFAAITLLLPAAYIRRLRKDLGR